MLNYIWSSDLFGYVENFYSSVQLKRHHESNSQFLFGSLSVEEELFVKERLKIPLSLCL